jgi:hypothetical protein
LMSADGSHERCLICEKATSQYPAWQPAPKP